jgi:uncharacterized protein (DUF111 family)
VSVLGHPIRMKVVTLPDGATRAKPEFDDVVAAATATGQPISEIVRLAAHAMRPDESRKS